LIDALVHELVQHTLSALREVSQMADNKHNWLDSIKKLPGWITGFIAFVSLEAQWKGC